MNTIIMYDNNDNNDNNDDNMIMNNDDSNE